jgi:GR25 family glycosyltransferase involved in LPS biosynthesis
MKAYVITIDDLNKSVKAAQRCINSAAKYNLHVENFSAITPINTNVYSKLSEEGIQGSKFSEEYSRLTHCTAAFLSHFSLWKACAEDDCEYTIFEHDAMVFNEIPNMKFDKVISLGKPSYGKYNIPMLIGVNPLTSKKYFPGAHAYRLKPEGARLLIEQARKEAKPTDIFLNKETFPFLQEYYPWPVEVRDTFTTIQNVAGCWAKHGFNNNYEIL